MSRAGSQDLRDRVIDAALKEALSAHPAAARFGVGIATAIVWVRRAEHASEQDEPDVASRREAWFDGQPELDPARLIFIDETWASTNIAHRRGRSPNGERLRSGVPHGH